MGLFVNDIEMPVLSCGVVFFSSALPSLFTQKLCHVDSLSSLQLNQELGLQTGAGSVHTLIPARSHERTV